MSGFRNKVLWRGTQKTDPAIADLQAIEERYASETIDYSAAAGSNILNATAIPAGKICVITHICAFNNISAMTGVTLQAAGAHVKKVGAVNVGTSVNWSGHLYLYAAEFVRCIFSGCTAGDDLYFTVLGYYIDIY